MNARVHKSSQIDISTVSTISKYKERSELNTHAELTFVSGL
jgi:hypothetical protein